MEESSKVDLRNIDPEWVYLLNTARHLGITVEEIRRFLNEQKLKKDGMQYPVFILEKAL